MIGKYKQIAEHLDTLTEQGKLSAYNRTTILEIANKVVKSLMSNYEKAMKGVESVIGGAVKRILKAKGEYIFIKVCIRGRIC
ncbi:MAG: hypothetical protein LUC97_11240 [Clostridiales bacterium]|nr:hypothetical protein [Clostridiales bacterium]